MEINLIKTDADYEETLKEIEALFDAEPDTPEADRLELLVTLVEAYEEKYFKIPPPDPIDAIKYHMERLGLSRKDLEPYIGTRARVSEILNRRRPLTLRMIRNLVLGLDIPASILIQEYDLVIPNPQTDDRADQYFFEEFPITQSQVIQIIRESIDLLHSFNVKVIDEEVIREQQELSFVVDPQNTGNTIESGILVSDWPIRKNHRNIHTETTGTANLNS